MSTETKAEPVDVPVEFVILVEGLEQRAISAAQTWLRANPAAWRPLMPRGVPREVAADRASTFIAREFAFEIQPLILDLIAAESGRMTRDEGLAAARALGELVIQRICGEPRGG